MISIIGTIIGVLILVAGVYYLTKEKEDADSRQIYTVISVIGAIVTVIGVVTWIL